MALMEESVDGGLQLSESFSRRGLSICWIVIFPIILSISVICPLSSSSMWSPVVFVHRFMLDNRMWFEKCGWEYLPFVSDST